MDVCASSNITSSQARECLAVLKKTKKITAKSSSNKLWLFGLVYYISRS
jgi:hypothetical protein